MDGRASFNDVAQSVARTFQLRLDDLREKIHGAESRGMVLLEGVQSDLDSKLEGASVDAALAHKRSMVEEIEYAREVAEMDELLKRLASLEEPVRSGFGRPALEPDGDYDAYDVVVRGQKRRIHCFPNWTYTVVDR
jgi:hypothetical protein